MLPAGLLKEMAEVVPAASLILQAALDHCCILFLLGKGTDLPDILENETDMVKSNCAQSPSPPSSVRCLNTWPPQKIL